MREFEPEPRFFPLPCGRDDCCIASAEWNARSVRNPVVHEMPTGDINGMGQRGGVKRMGREEKLPEHSVFSPFERNRRERVLNGSQREFRIFPPLR